MLKYAIVNEEVEIIGCDRKELRSTDGVLIIPTHIEGKQVKSIRNCAFKDCIELKKIIIEGDSHLGWGTFEECENLETFIAPKITKIENEDVFRFCYSLTEVDLSSLEKIDDICTFAYCKSLKKLELPNLKQLHSWNSFGHTENLEILSLPSLETCGSLVMVSDIKGERESSALVKMTGKGFTELKHTDPKIDMHTPSLKKLVIPRDVVNEDFDLSVLNFEVELV